MKAESRTLILVCSKVPKYVGRKRDQRIFVSDLGVVSCAEGAGDLNAGGDVESPTNSAGIKEADVEIAGTAAEGAEADTEVLQQEDELKETTAKDSTKAADEEKAADGDAETQTAEQSAAAATSKKKEEKEKIESQGAGAVPLRFYFWLAGHTKTGTISLIVVFLTIHTLLKMFCEYIIALYGEQNDTRRVLTNAAGGDATVGQSAYAASKEDNAIDFLSPWWSDSEKSADDEAVQFVFVFGILMLLFVLLFYVAAILLVQGTLSISRLMHRNLLDSLCAARLSFYEATPVGRILNRCSADFDVIDHQLPQNAESYFNCVVKLATAVVVMSLGAPFFLAPMLLFLFFFVHAQDEFRPLARLLQRNASADRSPVFSKFDQFLQGLAVIQAHGKEEGRRWYAEFSQLLDVQHQSYWIMNQGNRWWGVRLEALSVLLLALVPICLWCWKEWVDSSLAKPVIAVVILNSMQMTFLFNWSVRMRTEFEAKMVSVERVHEYTALESEEVISGGSAAKPALAAGVEKGDHVEMTEMTAAPAAAPPSSGNTSTTGRASILLSFADVKLRYKPHLPYALKGVSFQLPAGSATAVIGRTGSGKSSLFAVLLRMVDDFEGVVELAGQSVKNIALPALRGTYLAAVPQDPLLFSGPIRHSLVPSEMRKNLKIFVDNDLEKYTAGGDGVDVAGTTNITPDSVIYAALETVGLKDLVDERGGLDNFIVDPTATDLSFGQRQLLCVARALIKVRSARAAGPSAKIVLISDEATSSLDRATDLKIQTVLSNEAKCLGAGGNVCVLSIVHTLDSIIPCYDYVLTMSDGQVESYGNPKQIAEREGSLFSEMLAKAAGGASKE